MDTYRSEIEFKVSSDENAKDVQNALIRALAKAGHDAENARLWKGDEQLTAAASIRI